MVGQVRIHCFIRYMKPLENRGNDISEVLSRVAAFNFNELNTSLNCAIFGWLDKSEFIANASH
jgi:hypothetical protein